MLWGRSWGARAWSALERSYADLGRFWVFLGACFVRRFSLNALSVPPLGQVQARVGASRGPLGGSWDALGRSWDVWGRLWAFLGAIWGLLERSWSFLGSLGLQVVDLL